MLVAKEDKEERDRVKAEARLARQQQRSLDRQQRSEDRQDRIRIQNEEKEKQKELKAAREKRDRERYGKLVLEEYCAGKIVRIYDKCFVRVSGVIIGKNDAPYEKLQAVSGDADVAKKSGLGRAAVAGMTMGANLLFTPNKRGDLYLTIVTSQRTHLLHMEAPNQSNMKSMHKIATTCKAILDATAALHVSVETKPDSSGDIPSKPPSTDFVEQLQKLAELRHSGILSEAEFDLAKSRILGSSGFDGTSGFNNDDNLRYEDPTTVEAEQQLVDVILLDAPRSLIEVIKTIRQYTSVGLAEAKNLVDNCPSKIADQIDRETAIAFMNDLEILQAHVEIR